MIFKGVPGVFQGVSRKLQENFQGVSKKFHVAWLSSQLPEQKEGSEQQNLVNTQLIYKVFHTV